MVELLFSTLNSHMKRLKGIPRFGHAEIKIEVRTAITACTTSEHSCCLQGRGGCPFPNALV